MQRHNTILIAALLCIGLFQPAQAATIKMIKQKPITERWAWSYKLLTKSKEDSEQVTSASAKFNRRMVIVPINEKEYAISLQIVDRDDSKIMSTLGLKKGDNYALYRNRGILVDVDGQASLVNLDEAPFAPTKKVALQKIDSDGKKWVVSSENPDGIKTQGQESYKGGITFEYGTVDIKKSLSTSKGLLIPQNKAFTLIVRGIPNKDYVATHFTAKQANTLKKIAIDANGKGSVAQ